MTESPKKASVVTKLKKPSKGTLRVKTAVRAGCDTPEGNHGRRHGG